MTLIISEKSDELGTPKFPLNDIKDFNVWINNVTVFNLNMSFTSEQPKEIKGPDNVSVFLSPLHIIEILNNYLDSCFYKTLKSNNYHFWFIFDNYLYGYKYGYLGEFIDGVNPKITFRVKELIKQKIE